MPKDPLPKPSKPPEPPKDQASGNLQSNSNPPVSGSFSVQPPQKSAPPPPSSQPPAPPVAKPAVPSTPPVQPKSETPQPPVAPPQPSATQNDDATPPASVMRQQPPAPQSQQSVPPAPAPTQTSSAVVRPIPGINAPQQPAPQGKTAMPPRSLSALSSMSSNSIPQDKPGAPVAPPPPPSSSRLKPGAPPEAGANPNDKKPPTFANVTKSPLRFLPIILLALLLIGGGIFAFTRFFGGGRGTTSVTQAPPPSTGGNTTTQPTSRPVNNGQQVTLEYWGLWEPTEVMDQIIADYEDQNPGVTINYSQASHKNYRLRLQTAISSGQGPDIFRYHSTWVPMLKEELSTLPTSVMGAAEYKQTYYPVVSSQLQVGGQIVGMPLMYDGLALLYDKDALQTANVSVPQTWKDIVTTSQTLTLTENGRITRGGIALGTTANVEHFSDILAVLMIQNGATFAQPNSKEARDALLFYSKFSTEHNVWNDTLPASSVAFA